MKISKRARSCELSPIRKFAPFAATARARGTKIYHLNIGQPDIATPPAFYEAVRDFSNPVLEYAGSDGRPELIEAIIGYYKKLGVSFDPADILITVGGSEALSILMMCILDPGSEVLIPEPFYPNYSTFITAAGGCVCPIPTSPETGYQLPDRAEIEARINENTRAILITNPSNPTGVVLTDAQQRMLADIAKKHGLYLISDEVYREFAYNTDTLSSLASYEDVSENVVIIDSVSKRFSACGARIGCLISKNSALMAEAMKFCQARLCVATLDQVAAARLYEADSDYFAATKEEYRQRRNTVISKLKNIPGVICSEPEGAFYLMAALPVDDAEKFQTWLLDEFEDNKETVMFAPGRSFYATPGKGINEIRIAYVLNQNDLARAMDLLALGIEKYNAR